MNKLYSRVNWENSSNTPLNATNMNKMDKAIDDLDDRVISMNSTIESNGTSIKGSFNDVSISGSTITFTKNDGTSKSETLPESSGNSGGEATIDNKHFTVGSGCSASGDYSQAFGYSCSASGNYSHAEGYNSSADSQYSHTEGYFTQANDSYSHAEGCNTVSRYMAHAEGVFTIANDQQHAQGHYNVESTSLGGIQGTTGDAFIIGNGTSSTRSNAIRVTYAGKMYCKSSYSSTGADYAEYFEWLDGNADSEERYGYFVTLDGEKIAKANSGDYVLGVVSNNPSVVGNSDECWNGQFEKDIWGNYKMQTTKEKYIDKVVNADGEIEEVEKERDVTFYVVNPDYDSTKEYIQREDRKEWDTVGMMGVLPVRDDGTCVVNGFCTVKDGGIATNSDTGYRVISRVTENVVKIVLK